MSDIERRLRADAAAVERALSTGPVPAPPGKRPGLARRLPVAACVSFGVLVIGGMSVLLSDDSGRLPAGDNTSGAAVPAVQSIRERFEFDHYHQYSPDGADSDRTIEDEADGALVVTGPVSEVRPGVGNVLERPVGGW